MSVSPLSTLQQLDLIRASMQTPRTPRRSSSGDPPKTPRTPRPEPEELRPLSPKEWKEVEDAFAGLIKLLKQHFPRRYPKFIREGIISSEELIANLNHRCAFPNGQNEIIEHIVVTKMKDLSRLFGEYKSKLTSLEKKITEHPDYLKNRAPASQNMTLVFVLSERELTAQTYLEKISSLEKLYSEAIQKSEKVKVRPAPLTPRTPRPSSVNLIQEAEEPSPPCPLRVRTRSERDLGVIADSYGKIEREATGE